MKKRVLSAAVLIAIFVPLIIIKGVLFQIGLGIVSLLIYKEILDLVKKNKDIPSLVKFLGMFSLLIIVYNIQNENILYFSLGLMLLTYLIPTIFYNSEEYSTNTAFYLIGWTLLIGIFLGSLNYLVNNNILTFVFLLLITIFNDTFALIFGKLIGQHKLLPKVSPNKTWEGSISGFLLGTFIAVMFYINIINPTIDLFLLIIVTGILSIVGQLGDLLFSKIKREAKIKDFSNLIPGHGGLLDRFDSLIFVEIAFMMMINLI